MSTTTSKRPLRVEKVLGLTTTCNASMSTNPATGDVAYAAGCHVVVYSAHKNMQHAYVRTAAAISCLRYSSEGRYLAVGERGEKPAITVWDMVKHVRLGDLHLHDVGVSCCAFSLDNKLLVSVGLEQIPRLVVSRWGSGTMLLCLELPCPMYTVECLPSADGYSIAVGGEECIRFWTVAEDNDGSWSGKEVKAGLTPDYASATFVDIKRPVAPGGQYTPLMYGLTRCGALVTFRENRNMDKWVLLETDTAFALSVTPDYVACACHKGVVRLFATGSLEYIATLPSPVPKRFGDLSYTAEFDPSRSLSSYEPDKDYPAAVGVQCDPIHHQIMVVYDDRSLVVWDARRPTRAKRASISRGHDGAVFDVASMKLSGSKGAVKHCTYTAGADGVVRLWSLDGHKATFTRGQLVAQYVVPDDDAFPDSQRSVPDTGHSDLCLAVSPFSGGAVIVGGPQGRLVLLDGRSLTEVDEILLPDGTVVRSMSCDSMVTPEPDAVPFQEIGNHTGTSTQRGSSKGSTTKKREPFPVVAVGCSAGEVHLVAVNQWKMEIKATIRIQDGSPVHTVRLSPGSDTLVCCSASGTLGIYDVQLQADSTFRVVVRKVVQIDPLGAMCLDMDRSGRYLVAAGQSGQGVSLRSTRTGKSIRTYHGEGAHEAIAVAFDPSGLFMAVSLGDHSVRLLDFFSGKTIAKASGHTGKVTGISFSPDHKRLLTCSQDGCLLIWRFSHELYEEIKARLMELSSKGPKPSSPVAQIVLDGNYVTMPKEVRGESRQSNVDGGKEKSVSGVSQDLQKNGVSKVDEENMDENAQEQARVANDFSQEQIKSVSLKEKENITNDLSSQEPNNITNDLSSQEPNNITNDLSSQGPNNITNDLSSQGPNNITNDLTPQEPNNITNDLTPQEPNNITNDLTPQEPNNITNDLTPQEPNNITDDLSSQEQLEAIDRNSTMLHRGDMNVISQEQKKTIESIHQPQKKPTNGTNPHMEHTLPFIPPKQEIAVDSAQQESKQGSQTVHSQLSKPDGKLQQGPKVMNCGETTSEVNSIPSSTKQGNSASIYPQQETQEHLEIGNQMDSESATQRHTATKVTETEVVDTTLATNQNGSPNCNITIQTQSNSVIDPRTKDEEALSGMVQEQYSEAKETILPVEVNKSHEPENTFLDSPPTSKKGRDEVHQHEEDDISLDSGDHEDEEVSIQFRKSILPTWARTSNFNNGKLPIPEEEEVSPKGPPPQNEPTITTRGANEEVEIESISTKPGSQSVANAQALNYRESSKKSNTVMLQKQRDTEASVKNMLANLQRMGIITSPKSANNDIPAAKESENESGDSVDSGFSGTACRRSAESVNVSEKVSHTLKVVDNPVAELSTGNKEVVEVHGKEVEEVAVSEGAAIDTTSDAKGTDETATYHKEVGESQPSTTDVISQSATRTDGVSTYTTPTSSTIDKVAEGSDLDKVQNTPSLENASGINDNNFNGDVDENGQLAQQETKVTAEGGLALHDDDECVGGDTARLSGQDEAQKQQPLTDLNQHQTAAKSTGFQATAQQNVEESAISVAKLNKEEVKARSTELSFEGLNSPSIFAQPILESVQVNHQDKSSPSVRQVTVPLDPATQILESVQVNHQDKSSPSVRQVTVPLDPATRLEQHDAPLGQVQSAEKPRESPPGVFERSVGNHAEDDVPPPPPPPQLDEEDEMSSMEASTSGKDRSQMTASSMEKPNNKQTTLRSIEEAKQLCENSLAQLKSALANTMETMEHVREFESTLSQHVGRQTSQLGDVNFDGELSMSLDELEESELEQSLLDVSFVKADFQSQIKSLGSELSSMIVESQHESNSANAIDARNPKSSPSPDGSTWSKRAENIRPHTSGSRSMQETQQLENPLGMSQVSVLSQHPAEVNMVLSKLSEVTDLLSKLKGAN